MYTSGLITEMAPPTLPGGKETKPTVRAALIVGYGDADPPPPHTLCPPQLPCAMTMPMALGSESGTMGTLSFWEML